MRKSTGFLFGLLASGLAAYLAFKHLDPARRERLIDHFDAQVDQFKNHAVDYAFYANDAVSNAAGLVHHRLYGSSRSHHAAKSDGSTSGPSDQSLQPQFATSASHLRSALKSSGGNHHNDIVVNADTALNVNHSDTVIFYPDGNVVPLS